ncbi:MAG: hypothetical protein AAF597_19500, partial [Bacteroidota bacterium]
AKAGVYHLRAYTDYMRNNPASYFYRRAVPIYNPKVIGDGMLLGIDLGPGPKTGFTNAEQPFRLEISPEGGTCVGGVENTFIVSATDTLGQPLTLEGAIIDVAEEPVAPFSTSYGGRGLVKFVPAPGKAYWAQVDYQGVGYRVRLPKVQDKGVALHVNNLRDDAVFVSLASKNSGAAAGAMLVGHVRGEVFLRLSEVPLNEEMAFSRNQIQQGLATFSLLSADGKLLAERSFFNDYAADHPVVKVDVPYAFFRPRQRVRLELSWADSLLEQGADLSVSVTDRTIVRRPIGEPSIASHLLLNTEVATGLDRVGGQVLALDQRQRFLLDLELATAVGGRYDLPALLLGLPPASTSAPQNGQTISGYVTVEDRPEERQMAE